PNDTDFTPLKAVGVQGLNIAFIETYQNYHTRLDTIENLDPRSVQHMGANVLGIIERFGNLNQSPPKEPDLVYFNWFGSWLVVYPVWLAWAAAVLAPVLFVIFCLRSAGRSYLTFGRTVAGFGMFFLQLLLLLIGSFAAFALAKLIAGEFQPGDTRSNQFLFCGVMGIGLGLAVASQRFLRDKVGLVNLHAGQLLAVSLVTLVVCWFLIGGSYVLQWPLLFAMAGMLLSFRLSKPASLICQCVFAIAALLILVPLAYMFFVALTFTYVAVGAAALLLALLLALAPALFDQLAGNSKLALIFLFLVSIVLIGSGIRLCGWSAAHPRADTLIYSLNTDENKAKWVSYDAAPDAWTASVLGSTPRKQSDPAYTAGLNRPVFASDAAVVSLESPAVAMTQNFVSEGQQTMTLQIKSRRDARSVIVRLPADLKLSGAGWNGQVEPIHNELQANVPWTFRFFNAPPEGVSFMLRFPAQNRVHVLVGDTTPGLPTIEPLPPRPADTTPGYGSDITLVAGAHEF
ncbi:MAG: M28 family peptidase, partial [Chthoniobacterales bacterium]